MCYEGEGRHLHCKLPKWLPTVAPKQLATHGADAREKQCWSAQWHPPLAEWLFAAAAPRLPAVLLVGARCTRVSTSKRRALQRGAGSRFWDMHVSMAADAVAAVMGTACHGM